MRPDHAAVRKPLGTAAASVASVGDLNGDGYADLVVGDTAVDGTGGAYVIHGSTDWLV